MDALAVAVFDHGDAPPGVSDRRFRFDYLAERLAGGRPADLAAFAFLRDAIPPEHDPPGGGGATPGGALAALPLLAMDTGPAAVLGALEDPAVAAAARAGALVVNVGNFHTLAFHLVGGQVAGLFEHHTGELTDGPAWPRCWRRLAAGTLTNAEVFDSQGHGALVLDRRRRRRRRCSAPSPGRAGPKLLPRLPWPSTRRCPTAT